MAGTETLMGFAARSRNLVAGAGTCESNMKRGKLALLIITEDAAEGSREKMKRMADAAGVPCRIYGSSDTLSKAAGAPGRCVFGITDRQFAGSIIREIDRGEGKANEEKEVF
ncbi:MAG: ribosomal L7Ae/L30e/S12e/Gadd45 family protein [Anaerovoracaceae bacterium]|nr:ribosomal L7Ae/L30e/S12e/Gadd45 family protein [Anaerovoracaceae bacterium]